MPLRRVERAEVLGHWKFYDFLSSSGRNYFQIWLHEQGPVVKQKVNALIRNLEKLDRAFDRDDKVGLLRKDDCAGEHLIELRIKMGNVQYRPIGWYGPNTRQVTMLLGATERDRELVPRNSCRTAIERKKAIINGRGSISEHRLD